MTAAVASSPFEVALSGSFAGHFRLSSRADIGTSSSAAIVAVPASQAYYWTETWQRNERRAIRDIAEGRVARFDNTEDALAWLIAD